MFSTSSFNFQLRVGLSIFSNPPSVRRSEKKNTYGVRSTLCHTKEERQVVWLGGEGHTPCIKTAIGIGNEYPLGPSGDLIDPSLEGHRKGPCGGCSADESR